MLRSQLNKELVMSRILVRIGDTLLNLVLDCAGWLMIAATLLLFWYGYCLGWLAFLNLAGL